MITFLDENDVEYGALATIKATNAVNGERSITGEIISGDVVLSRIERGWRLRFEDEYYVVTYAKPIDEGKNVQVSFDAVHQFFWDFGKSSVYDQLSDGSHTFRAYLDFIFNDSGYRYDIESSLTVKAFEKQSFGYKNRLSLFNDIITSSGVEFQVNGKVVRILAKVGTDLSTVVRKNFNLNELGIEKNIGNFVTYQKGFGAYFDEEDHSKGRLIAEYTSPLASVYGKLEADPLVDERYKQQESLLSALKETVDNSYTISVSLDMEDLTRAGYRYTQPVAGDYIMAINETLGFKEKIRIVSFTSEYDVTGQLIKHTVTCNDIGSVKKLSASYTQTQHQAANAEVNANTAYEFANKALVSANGKNTNYYGDTFPVDNPKGTLKTGDLLFLTVGDTVKQYYWNGADWVINPVLDDVEAFKEQIADELKDVPNREEFENKISEEIATSKAEITTQIETAKTQAESNAKEYADTINEETAKVAELANAAAGEIKADLVNVKNNLTATSLVANNAQAAVDAAKQGLANVASELNTAKQELADSVTAVNNKVDSAKAEVTQAKQDLANVADDLSTAKQDFQNAVSAVDTKATNLQSDLSQAKQDLASQAQQLQEQAGAQSELTNRVSSVEKTANGTKTTVSELSKTVAQNGKDITSVTNRTKTVEDDLANTKTTLTQVQTTANSASQKTATLETGLNGLSAKFDSLKVGGRNLLAKTNQGKLNWRWSISSGGTTAEDFDVNGINAVKLTRTSDASVRWSYIQYNGLMRKLIEPNTQYTLSFDVKPNVDVTFTTALMRGDGAAPLTNKVIMNQALANRWTKASCVLTSKTTLPDDLSQVVYLEGMPTANGNWLIIKNIKLEKGNVATDYSPSEVDFEQKVAEYKQSADQNYASLQTTVQNLDGTVQHNKTVADQTAQAFTTRIESLETYKDGESERANAYFESAKTETAKQLTAERTAIAKDYVAKSTYTSDVTGIRNELSATTSTANATKTNLANYQASNDRAVANLQSNIQTANGDISSLKTKVEAVPGQITSAVSAVESKIPTEIGARNYIRDYGLTATGWTSLKPAWKFEIISDSTAKSGQYLKATCTTASTGLGGFYKHLFDFSDGRFFGKQMTWSMDVKTSKNTSIQIGCEWGNALSNVNVTENWQRFSKTFKVATSSNQKAWIFYSSNWNVGDIVYIRDVQLEDGSIATSPVPAIEDTQSDITKLSSEIKQTADGITLLATKTELNNAKNELQSGINTATNKANNAQNKANSNAQTISTHTTQISALNTGLQAKVSQTDFNTLSGRVTTAENNITAKANELSSKITSVEGKIPTNLDSLNLMTGTRDWSTKANKWHMGANWSTEREEYQGLKVHSTQNGFNGSHQNIFVKNGDVITFSFFAKATNTLSKIKVSSCWNGSSVYQAPLAGVKESDEQITITSDWKRYSKTVHITSDGSLQFRTEYDGATIPNGNTFYVAGLKLAKSALDTGYSENPTDAASDITKLSTTLTQTADGLKQLSTQVTSQGNTITSHTNSINSLTTGLSAKVSQSDFNTLSGRVTTAENNITAKANELSSKITSVEGKIPTTVGGRNYLRGTSDKYQTYTSSNYVLGFPSTNRDWSKLLDPLRGKTVTIRAYIKNGTDFPVRIQVWANIGGINANTIPAHSEGWSVGTGKMSSDWTSANVAFVQAGNGANNGGTIQAKEAKLEIGNIPTDWSPAPEDYDSKLATVQSEFKQTTDSIKASVTSLDKSTVKNSSLTINADGIVMKAGKSTTDVANAIGSYFSVNQNAINLFSDKINVKGSMIVSGAITSDKIASKQINTAHLNGKIITADVISSNAVTANAIKAGAVTTDKMSANSINGDRIAAGTLDAAKIKAGSITASQIASGTITSNQIKAGGISSASIAAGAITTDKIAAGAIDANKIAANAITANMIRGGQLNSTNGATVFDLNAGTLTFNNNYGYIQRVASDKVFEITTNLLTSSGSREYLASAFKIRKSDNSRLAGAEFTLYNTLENKPTAEAKIYADGLILYDSQYTSLFSVYGKNTYLGNTNLQNWGDIPVARLNGGLIAKDIAIGSHRESLLKIVEELCKKTGILWV